MVHSRYYCTSRVGLELAYLRLLLRFISALIHSPNKVMNTNVKMLTYFYTGYANRSNQKMKYDVLETILDPWQRPMGLRSS